MTSEVLGYLASGLAGAGVGWWIGVAWDRSTPDPRALVQEMERVSNAEATEYQRHLAALNLLRAKRKGMRPGDNPNAPALVFRSRLRRRPVKPRWPNENDQES